MLGGKWDRRVGLGGVLEGYASRGEERIGRGGGEGSKITKIYIFTHRRTCSTYTHIHKHTHMYTHLLRLHLHTHTNTLYTHTHIHSDTDTNTDTDKDTETDTDTDIDIDTDIDTHMYDITCRRSNSSIRLACRTSLRLPL